MGFAIGPSLLRFVLAALLALFGAFALVGPLSNRLGGGLGCLCVAVFLLFCYLCWCRELQRQPVAMRLMGNQEGDCHAILYYRSTSRRRQCRGFGAVDDVTNYEAVDVHVDGMVHWPGAFVGLSLRRRLVRAGLAAPARRDRSKAVLPFPRHLLIFADVMPRERFHAFGLQIRCLQRGVTLVEDR